MTQSPEDSTPQRYVFSTRSTAHSADKSRQRPSPLNESTVPDPTLLGDIIQPAWQSLTPEQRTCWHFWAATHPELDESGRLVTLYGQQAHYAKNADIATAVTVPLLDDPPPNSTPPFTVAMVTYAWPIQSLLGGTVTARQGLVWAELDDPVPSNQIVIVKQGYDRKKTGTGRPPRIRHVTILLPLDTGMVNLQIPTGYYATTSGDNRYSTIRGITARRRPDRPLGTVRIVNIENGQTIRETMDNPFGGSRTKTNRPRATAYKPLSGINHYP